MGQRDRSGRNFDDEPGFARKAGDKPLEYEAGGSTPAVSREIGGDGRAAGFDFDLGMGGGGPAGVGRFRTGSGELSQNDEGGGEDEEVQSLRGGTNVTRSDDAIDADGFSSKYIDKADVNGVQIDMVTGQVIRSGGSGGEDRLVETTAGGEDEEEEIQAAIGGGGGDALSQNDEGGGEDEEIQAAVGAGGGGALSQNDEGGGEDEEVQSLMGAGGDPVGVKTDWNGAQIDMVTGQVIGSAAPATGGELAGTAGVAQAGGGDAGVQSMGAGFAPAGAVVGQSDPDDGDDPGVQSMGASGDAALAMGSADAFGAETPATPQLGTGMTPGDDVDDAFGPPPGEG